MAGTDNSQELQTVKQKNTALEQKVRDLEEQLNEGSNKGSNEGSNTGSNTGSNSTPTNP